MSALTLGLHAANAYFQEGDRRRERERAEQRFQNEQERMDWERKRTHADIATLPERTEAARSGAKLSTARNQAGLDMLPGEVQNTRTEQALKAGELKGKMERQPTELATATNSAELARLSSEVAVEDLPRVIAQRRTQGVLSDTDTGTLAIGKLGDLIQMGDQGRVIKFMNDMQGAMGGGKTPVAAVSVEDDPKSGERLFIARDAQGGVVAQYSVNQIQAVRSVLNSHNKPELMAVNAGDTVLDKRTGKPVFTAPESAKSTTARMGPLERDVDYLVRAHGMGKDEALSRLQSAKTMSREQFILKGASDMQAMGKRPTPKDLDDLGALYERATGQRPAQAPAAAQPGGPGLPSKPLDPAVQRLLGL